LPFFLVLGAFALSAGGHPPRWWLLLPGLIALPVYSMIPGSDGDAVPLSRAGEEAKSASRGLVMIGSALVAIVIALLASWSRRRGWFWPVRGRRGGPGGLSVPRNAALDAASDLELARIALGFQ
jgi:hypothetical protein